MKSPLILSIFFIVLLISCKEKDQTKKIQCRNDLAAQFFERSKETEDLNQKLTLLKKALAEIYTPQDTLQATIYDNLIYFHNKKKEIDSSVYYANLLIKNGFEQGDTLQVAKGYYRKAKSFFYQNDQINVLNNTFQSQRYYLLAGDSVNAGKRLLELSIAQTRLGDFPASQNSAVKALSLLKPSKDSFYIASSYNNLAATYRKLKDFDEAIEEYSNALKYINSSQDSLAVVNNIANVYAEKEDFKKSLGLLESILPLAENQNFINRIRDNYYFTKWLSEKTDITDSLELIMEARSKHNDLTGLLSSYDHLVKVNEKDSPKEALRYAKAYYETSRKLNSVTDEISALDYLVRLSPVNEIKPYALEHIRLNDSLIKSRDKVKNLFAKIKYDEEQKLEEIDQLEKISIQQQLEVLRGRNRLNIAILLGILLTGSAAVIYYYSKQRHKKERIREIHATEARISKKIHDELANDVYNVMTELENPDHSYKRGTVKKLESIYDRTRNISRENTPVTTSSGYREDLQDMLSQSVPQQTTLYLIGLKDISWSKLSTESKIVVHRVLQELMVNMKKHSEASIVKLNFKETSSKLTISYIDNGKGFSSAELKKGAGLKNVENRIDSIGGSFNFQPETTEGFSAQIVIPF
ncbi:tetratricopeptide repeat protein [Zunongwangia sp. F363]|uniref:histidine kinase n=1 Tax=Autumnicola tepida TaxID=3075595 RepID=A0ABU3C5M9_9FLAO|nr:tetratricopeptide repeat protein [Zunongwangia sp. F363]MDT0641631.1 tetratricopeptide repeat protein [Zunongwangia sp. F363]